MEVLNNMIVRHHIDEVLLLSARDYSRFTNGEGNVALYGFVRKASIDGLHSRTDTHSHANLPQRARPSSSANAGTKDGTFPFSSLVYHADMLL
jgi:hypothetical protein